MGKRRKKLRSPTQNLSLLFLCAICKSTRNFIKRVANTIWRQCVEVYVSASMNLRIQRCQILLRPTCQDVFFVFFLDFPGCCGYHFGRLLGFEIAMVSHTLAGKFWQSKWWTCNMSLGWLHTFTFAVQGKDGTRTPEVPQRFWRTQCLK